MNFQEIKNELSKKDFDATKIDDRFPYKGRSGVVDGLEHLGTVECVDEYGGEGQGDDYWRVWKFVDHNVFIKIDGRYSSYDGVDFYDSEVTEVQPVTKQVIVYEVV